MRLVRIIPPVLSLIALQSKNTTGLNCNLRSCFGCCNKNKSEVKECTDSNGSEGAGAQPPEVAEQKNGAAISLDDVKTKEGKKVKGKIDKAKEKLEWRKKNGVADWEVNTALSDASREVKKVQDDNEKKALEEELQKVREEFKQAKQQKKGGTGTGKTVAASGGGTGQATGGGDQTGGGTGAAATQ